MLTYLSAISGTPILSLHQVTEIGFIIHPIIDPRNFKIIAFRANTLVRDESDREVLLASSIREISRGGYIINSVEEILPLDDIVRDRDIILQNYSPLGKNVVTESGKKLGRVTNATFENKTFRVMQLVLKPTLAKSLLSSELLIETKQIVEVDDKRIIIKDIEQTVKTGKTKEVTNFVPNFENPFRKTTPALEKSEPNQPQS